MPQACYWQCLIKSMSRPLLETVFGTTRGISEFNFLLLGNCKDSNYDGPGVSSRSSALMESHAASTPTPAESRMTLSLFSAET